VGEFATPLVAESRNNVQAEVHLVEPCGARFARGRNFLAHEAVDEFMHKGRRAAPCPIELHLH
jgi:hypothetical protein